MAKAKQETVAYPMYRVRWKDHYSMSGWIDASTLEIQDYINDSVGFLLHKGEAYTILGQTKGHDAHVFGDVIFILNTDIVEEGAV